MRLIDKKHSFILLDFIGQELLEPLEEKVWIAKTQCGDRLAIKGVSSGEVDFVVVPALSEILTIKVLELIKKTGKFSGSNRDRYTVRYLPLHQCTDMQCAVLHLVDNMETVSVVVETTAEKFENVYFKYTRVYPNNLNLEHIIRWHFGRYYKFLSNDDCSEATNELNLWHSQNASATLAALNRAASRILYRIARFRGFRKLTLREQKKYGLAGQWHSESEYAEAQMRIHSSYSPTGESEYTLRVSLGEVANFHL